MGIRKTVTLFKFWLLEQSSDCLSIIQHCHPLLLSRNQHEFLLLFLAFLADNHYLVYKFRRPLQFLSGACRESSFRRHPGISPGGIPKTDGHTNG